jgi:hypothetical protein
VRELEVRAKIRQHVVINPPLGKPIRFRVIDFYRSSGRRLRKIFWILSAENDQGSSDLWIEDGLRESRIVEYRKAMDIGLAIQELHKRFAPYVRSQAPIRDSPMTWTDVALLPLSTRVYYPSVLPPRFVWDHNSGGWIRDERIQGDWNVQALSQPPS